MQNLPYFPIFTGVAIVSGMLSVSVASSLTATTRRICWMISLTWLCWMSSVTDPTTSDETEVWPGDRASNMACTSSISTLGSGAGSGEAVLGNGCKFACGGCCGNCGTATCGGDCTSCSGCIGANRMCSFPLGTNA